MSTTKKPPLRPQGGPNAERWKGPDTTPGPGSIEVENGFPQGLLPGTSGTYSPRREGEDPQPFVIRQ